MVLLISLLSPHSTSEAGWRKNEAVGEQIRIKKYRGIAYCSENGLLCVWSYLVVT